MAFLPFGGTPLGQQQMSTGTVDSLVDLEQEKSPGGPLLAPILSGASGSVKWLSSTECGACLIIPVKHWAVLGCCVHVF